MLSFQSCVVFSICGLVQRRFLSGAHGHDARDSQQRLRRLPGPQLKCRLFPRRHAQCARAPKQRLARRCHGGLALAAAGVAVQQRIGEDALRQRQQRGCVTVQRRPRHEAKLEQQRLVAQRPVATQCQR